MRISSQGLIRGTVKRFSKEILSALWFNSNHLAAMISNQLGQELLIYCPAALYEAWVWSILRHTDLPYVRMLAVLSRKLRRQPLQAGLDLAQE